MTLRIAIIGSGPAGFYTASRILKSITSKPIQIDMLEGLPVPYGLVRFGIAPDHPEVKSVVNRFNEMAQTERLRFEFVGNVRLNTKGGSEGVTLQEIQKRYNKVILAYGSSQDRLLNIPGESLNGVVAARDFVAWYNGYPSQITPNPQQEVLNDDATTPSQNMARLLQENETAVIIGQGNVALDIARVLLIPDPVKHLGKTDMPTYAVEAFQKSKVKRVIMVGRRGPAHVSFSAKELREMVSLGQEYKIGLSSDADISQQEKLFDSQLFKERARKRVVQILKDGFKDKSDGDRRLELQFFKSPVRFLGSSEKLEGIEFEETQYVDGSKVEGTHNYSTIKTSLAFRSIGYRSVGVNGLPFDEAKGRIPHLQGRVLKSVHTESEQEFPYSDIMPNTYVTGWLKSGPVGVIASTMYDAYQTADCVVQDILSEEQFEPKPSREETLKWIEQQIGGPAVTFADWKIIEDEERRRGALLGKPYEKITSTDEILKVIREHKT